MKTCRKNIWLVLLALAIPQVLLAQSGEVQLTGPNAINNNNVVIGVGRHMALQDGRHYPDSDYLGLIYDGGLAYSSDNEYVIDLNNNNNPFAVGGDYNGNPLIWWRDGTTWKRKVIPFYSPDWTPGPISGGGRRINDRSEILGRFSSSDGKQFSYMIRNGQPMELDSKVSGWSGVYPADINNQGVILAQATKTQADDGTALPSNQQTGHPVLLVPMEVDYLSRDPNTGDIAPLGGEVSQSPPTPQVNLTVTDSTLTAGGDLTVTVQCSVRDELSEVLTDRSGALQSLTFYVNGQAVETVSNLAGQASGNTVPVWQPYASQATLTRTFTIPQPQSGTQEIKAITGLNAAGNQGWDTATVIITRPTTVYSSVAPTLPLTIRFGGSLSTTAKNTIYVTVGSNTEAALLESDVGTRFFTGNVQTGQGAGPISLWLGSAPALDPAQVEQFNALGQVSGTNFMGSWQETSASSRVFAPQSSYQEDDTTSSVPSIAGVYTAGGSPQGFLEPFAVRVTVPTNMAQWFTGTSAQMKVQLFGQNVDVVQNDSFVPNQTPPTGSTYLWVAKNSAPRLFALVPGISGDLSPPDALSKGEFRTTVQFTGGGNNTQCFLSDPGVVLQPDFSGGSSTNTAGGNTNSAHVNSDVVDASQFALQATAWYEVLFQSYGMNLKGVYQGAGLQIQFIDFNQQSYSPIYRLRNYYLTNTTPDDQRTGKTPILYVNTHSTNAVHAAQAMFMALNELRGWTIRDDLRLANFEQALNNAVTGDPSNATLYQALYQAQIQPIAGAISDCSQAAEVGLSILAEPAFWIFTAADVQDSLQQGDYTKAGTVLAMAALPSVAKRCFVAGRPLVLRLGGALQDLELSGPVLQALGSFSDKTLTRIQLMQILRPLIDNGTIPKELITQLYESGVLKIPKPTSGATLYAPGSPYRILVDELVNLGYKWNKKYPPHHLLPLENELKFLQVGLDPNAGESGMFLEKSVHDFIHSGKGWGQGGPWNYQWNQFFAESGAANYAAEDIITFRDKLKGLLEKNLNDPSKIDWPYPKP